MMPGGVGNAGGENFKFPKTLGLKYLQRICHWGEGVECCAAGAAPPRMRKGRDGYRVSDLLAQSFGYATAIG